MPLEKLSRARMVEALNLLGELADQEQVTLEFLQTLLDQERADP